MTTTAPLGITGMSTDLSRNLQIIAKEQLADRVVALTLAAPDGAVLPAWSPGAHLDLILGDDLIRQYSLCGDPADRDRWRIAVLREPEGRGGSSRVHDDLTVGDVVEVKGPRNNFGLVDAGHYLFIAGGIGITPILAMLAEVSAAGAEWSLLYGGRSRGAMAFADELAERHPDRTTLHPEAEHGLLDLDAALAATPAGTAVYCCGPEPLLDAVTRRCESRQDLDLHVERFTPMTLENTATDTDTAFELVLERSGREITVAADESVLDAMLRDGADVDFSCREGTCGTCEQSVVAGIPEHRDSVLSADEQAENDCMMVCVSRSRSARLVLDL